MIEQPKSAVRKIYNFPIDLHIASSSLYLLLITLHVVSIRPPSRPWCQWSRGVRPTDSRARSRGCDRRLRSDAERDRSLRAALRPRVHRHREARSHRAEGQGLVGQAALAVARRDADAHVRVRGGPRRRPQVAPIARRCAVRVRIGPLAPRGPDPADGAARSAAPTRRRHAEGARAGGGRRRAVRRVAREDRRHLSGPSSASGGRGIPVDGGCGRGARDVQASRGRSALNPNSRPRADDVCATCISMAVHGIEPDAELRARLEQIVKELGAPWQRRVDVPGRPRERGGHQSSSGSPTGCRWICEPSCAAFEGLLITCQSRHHLCLC